jgi:hypothetical protein
VLETEEKRGAKVTTEGQKLQREADVSAETAGDIRAWI